MTDSVSMRGRTLAPRVAAAVCLLLALGGCYKSLVLEDTETVGTFHDQDQDFASIRTYLLPDSVLHLGTGVEPSRLFDETILDRVAANLDNVGYRRVADPDAEEPDVLVVAFAVQSSDWYAFSTFAWWNSLLWQKGLENAVAGRYRIVFSWRPEDVYLYDAGSLFLLMLDLRDADETETLPGLWVAGISGLLAAVPSRIEARVVRNIDQAFVQSPYLGAGS